MIKELQHDAENRMKKRVEGLGVEMGKVRTGRAHPNLLEGISVLYYGNATPLSQVANVNVEDARTLSISPWDKGMVQAIEKAIRISDLGLNPTTAGTVIRVPLPPLTEERRRELVKHIRSLAEEGRIAVRNIRRDANQAVKDLLKAKKITEDEEKRAEDGIQKLTDRFIVEIDKMTHAKENELMHI